MKYADFTKEIMISSRRYSIMQSNPIKQFSNKPILRKDQLRKSSSQIALKRLAVCVSLKDAGDICFHSALILSQRHDVRGTQIKLDRQDLEVQRLLVQSIPCIL